MKGLKQGCRVVKFSFWKDHSGGEAENRGNQKRWWRVTMILLLLSNSFQRWWQRGLGWKLQRRWEESRGDSQEVKSPRFAHESARFLQRSTRRELCAYVLDNGLKEVVRFEGCTGVIDQYHPYAHICFSHSPWPTTFLSSHKVYSSRWGGVYTPSAEITIISPKTSWKMN